MVNQGTAHAAASWVFAGNGYPPPAVNPADIFENLYPGFDVVDIVGTSGYNFGGCPSQVEARVWETFSVMMKPYLDRLHVMAPDKLIFISETGSVDKPAANGSNKDVWLADFYTQATLIPNLRAIVYLNTAEQRESLNQCPQGADYRLYNPDTGDWTGFKNTVNTLSNYVYWLPDGPEMRQLFGDSPTSNKRVDRDFNGDGRSDILWQHIASGNAALWFMNANGTVQSSAGLGNLAGWTPTLGDFNGDGIADILWQNTSSGNAALWFMNANGTVQSTAGLGNFSSWTPRVGDFNGDGIADILWQNTSSGNAALWFMNANGTVQSSAGLGNLAGWTPTLGDFNGDGVADILWQHIASGNAALWFMNANGTVQSSAGLGNLAGWTPRLDDYNGDGIADILWQNTASGNAGIWFMNANGTVQSSIGLGSVPGWITQ